MFNRGSEKGIPLTSQILQDSEVGEGSEIPSVYTQRHVESGKHGGF